MPAAVTAVNFESADAAKGCALHTVSSPAVALASATSDLKLVLANVESAAEVGGAAAKSLGQKVEILALPKSLAASVAENGTGGLSSTIVDAGRDAAANILAEANQASLTDNILTRALQGAWNFTFWLGSSSKPPLPEGFDPATYVSLSVAFANLVNLSVLPLTVANLLLSGQWDAIPTTITSTTQKAVNSLFVGLPTSFLETLNWVLTGNPPTATLGAAATVDSLQANQESVLAAAPTLTDNILTRALQGAWNFTFWLGASSKPPLPEGFDPATYTSLSVAFANFVALSVLPLTVANLLLSGQWGDIPSTVTSTTSKALNTIVGLPTSFLQTLNWVLTGNPPATNLATATSVDTLQANQESVLAAAPTLTDNILTRGLQGAWNYTLWLGASSKPPLPEGFDPATYTSLSVAAANLINLSVLPLTVANLVLSGQWDAIPSTVTTTTQKAVNSVVKGLPTSFVQTVNWVVTGNPPAAPAVESTLLKAPVEGDASDQDAIAKGGSTKRGVLSGIVNNGGGTTKGGTIKPGGVIKDILNGGGTTKGGSSENGGSNENGSGSTENGGGSTSGGGSENGGGTTKGSTTKGAHHTVGHKLGTKKDADKGGK